MKTIKKLLKALNPKNYYSGKNENGPQNFNNDSDCEPHSFVEYYCDENGWFI